MFPNTGVAGGGGGKVYLKKEPTGGIREKGKKIRRPKKEKKGKRNRDGVDARTYAASQCVGEKGRGVIKKKKKARGGSRRTRT